MDLNDKKILWDFQETSHDIWNLDIPAPPILTSIIKNNENYKIFYYKDFCNNPENFFKELSNYLNTEIKYDFDKIEPFNVNGIYYNDEVIGLKNLHYIYSGKPKEEIYDIDKYLTNDIIEKIQKIEHESFANTKNN